MANKLNSRPRHIGEGESWPNKERVFLNTSIQCDLATAKTRYLMYKFWKVSPKE